MRSDVTDRGQVDALMRAALDWTGGLDILVNNAGLSGMAKFSSFMDLSEELWDEVLDANLKGVFLASQAAARHMIERGSGRIIHISSVMGLIGEEFAAAYCAAKAGVIGLTKVMALELAQHGIKVNCIAPGFIDWTETVQPIIDLMESPVGAPTPTPAPRPSAPARPATSATWRSSWPPTRAASSPAPPSPPTAACSPTDRRMCRRDRPG